MTCSHPGCTQPHGNWPDDTPDGLLCQDHWEEYSGRQWWQMVKSLDRAGLIDTTPA